MDEDFKKFRNYILKWGIPVDEEKYEFYISLINYLIKQNVKIKECLADNGDGCSFVMNGKLGR